MKIEILGARKAILDAAGHLLVLGGPGSGKTTIALLKAKERCGSLKPGQEILFLSFSRAAVRQILNRCGGLLGRHERDLIQVKTYHAFCIEVLTSHGQLLNGRPVRFLYPDGERLKKSDHTGDWEDEITRLSRDEGVYCFDHVARGVADLFERNARVRDLHAGRFPFVIVDEFQDTDDDQWRMVNALARASDLFCLADTDQRIFEYRKNVNPKRLDILRAVVNPTVFDLGSDNHRSPNAGILAFANAILRNQKPLPQTPDVKIVPYFPNAFPSMVHVAVVSAFGELRKRGIKDPCVAILCRANTLVATISGHLSEARTVTTKGRKTNLPAIDHTVVWDAELAAASAAVVASMLEWGTKTPADAVADTLFQITRFHRLKDALHPSASAKTATKKFENASAAVRACRTPLATAGKALVRRRAVGLRLFGDPTVDWLLARDVLGEIESLSEIFREVRLVRLFKATDEIGRALGDRWVKMGTYAGATRLVEQALNRQLLVSADRQPRGCVLMSIHKSKGKEFDGVVLVEGAFQSAFFDVGREDPPYEASRRLLRVGITRAKTLVKLVRPQNAPPLGSA